MKKLLFILVALYAAAGLFAKTTVLYHTSDTHGFFYPKNGQGGFATLAAVVNQEKKPYLLLDAGDFAEGTMETKTSKGIKAVQLMNKLGYAAATLGNHEFAYGEAALTQMIEAAHFPILAANLVEKETGRIPSFVLPYKIFTVGGVKIALIGLANANPTRPAVHYDFIDPLVALERVLGQAEVKAAHVVVVLVHDSLADDRPDMPFYVGEIGRQFAGRVHIVLGGHAHKTFTQERNGIVFEEVGTRLQNVGKVTIQTDDNTGKFVSATAEIIPLEIAQTGTDKAVASYAEKLKEPGMDEVLGQIAEDLTLPDPDSFIRDGSAENWIADVARAHSGAEIFVHNSAGVRTALEQGPITRRDLLDLFPFDDTIVRMPVTGAFLTELVKTSLYPRNLLSFSGLRVSYQLDKKNRVKKLRILVNGKKIKKNRMYELATNSYLAKGGSEGKLFKQIPNLQKTQVDATTLRELLIEALKQGPVSAPDTGRILRKK